MQRTVSKYWTIFLISLTERFTYRTDFLIGTLMRFLPIVTTIFLWKAVFAGSSNRSIAGLDQDAMIAYYVMAMIGRAFSSMPGLAFGIAGDIRTGNIKKYLTQPMDMVGFLLTSRVAHKLVYYAIATIPFAIVLYCCKDFFPSWPSLGVFLAFLISLILGFMIGFLFETLIGLLGFWILEIHSFGFVIIMLSYTLSGHMFPLDLLPPPIDTIVKFLPFQYLAYFPAKVFLNGESWGTQELWGKIALELAYVVALYVLVKFMFRRGLARYSAFGG